jgi:glucose/arabinose dehydrogenase
MKTFRLARHAARLGSAAALAAVAFSLASPRATAREPQPVPVVKGLVNPWALAFLPDGRMLITEKAGRIRIADAKGGVSAPLPASPAMPPIANIGQCGLLDLVLDPKFADNRFLYYTAPPRWRAPGSRAHPAKSGWKTCA